MCSREQAAWVQVPGPPSPICVPSGPISEMGGKKVTWDDLYKASTQVSGTRWILNTINSYYTETSRSGWDTN